MYDYLMEKLVYQMFILGCQNLDLALQKGLGGVIFFTKDIKDENQFKTLIKDIKSKSIIPPFLSIDQEGGRVERTENIRPKRISPRYAFEKGEKFLKTQSEEISRELHEYGINLNFAPCADVNTNPNNPIIGERSFSNNPNDVIKGIDIFTDASRKFGIIPCVKHFPGHGDADKDSHLTLPIINLPMDKMEEIHIKPFKHAIENNIEMIMAAHLHCTCFDPTETPASLSKNAVGYLRNTLNYNGVIITDDMVMKGVSKYGSLNACIMAINAGVDMFIFRNSDDETLKLIDTLAYEAKKSPTLSEKIKKSYERISFLKQKSGIA
jgi:beta-N-acetylhexosaminidase